MMYVTTVCVPDNYYSLFITVSWTIQGLCAPRGINFSYEKYDHLLLFTITISAVIICNVGLPLLVTGRNKGTVALNLKQNLRSHQECALMATL